MLITSVKIGKDNVKIIYIYESASFGGPECNVLVIPKGLNSRRAVTSVSWTRLLLTLQVRKYFSSSGHRGFLLQCLMWRLIPENGQLLITWQVLLFLLAGENITGFLCIMNILSLLNKYPVTQVSFCPKLLKRCFRKKNKLHRDANRHCF